MGRLTDQGVKKSRRRKEPYERSDGAGLSLRVGVSGTKSWLYRYRSPTTKRTAVITIGRYPSYSLAEARKEAADYRQLIDNGIDPKAEARAKKQRSVDAICGADLVQEYLRLY